jgi:hypothetical protein
LAADHRFRGIPDMERLPARTEPVAKDPERASVTHDLYRGSLSLENREVSERHSPLNVDPTSLPTTQSFYHAPDEAQGDWALFQDDCRSRRNRRSRVDWRRWLDVALLAGNRWRNMRWHWHGIVVPTVLGEDQAPLYVVAFRAHEGVVLEAGGCHGVVLDHMHQGHLSVARHTTHRTHSKQISSARPIKGIIARHCMSW